MTDIISGDFQILILRYVCILNFGFGIHLHKYLCYLSKVIIDLGDCILITILHLGYLYNFYL